MALNSFFVPSFPSIKHTHTHTHIASILTYPLLVLLVKSRPPGLNFIPHTSFDPCVTSRRRLYSPHQLRTTLFVSMVSSQSFELFFFCSVIVDQTWAFLNSILDLTLIPLIAVINASSLRYHLHRLFGIIFIISCHINTLMTTNLWSSLDAHVHPFAAVVSVLLHGARPSSRWKSLRLRSINTWSYDGCLPSHP